MTSTVTEVGDQAGRAVDNKPQKMDISVNAAEACQIQNQKERARGDEDVDGVQNGPKEMRKNDNNNQKNQGKKRRKHPFRRKPKKKTQTNTEFNLNNEVVKMRHEVKRVRVLVIRKMIRQMDILKKQKGTEKQLLQNQKKAAFLLEQLHAMKKLIPDVVTKTALQKELSMEALRNNHQVTMADRALTRIAVHPQFKMRIDQINAGVKAFKEQRMRELKGESAENPQNESNIVPSPAQENQVKGKKEWEEEHASVKQEESTDDSEEPTTCTVSKTKDIEEELKPTPLTDSKTPDAPISKPKSTQAKVSAKLPAKVADKAQTKTAQAPPKAPAKSTAKATKTKPAPNPAPDTLPTKAEEQESDLSDDEEKEYFDDSTEERFLRQSSLSECSDDDDDFFVGKVSKFKKKKRNALGGSEEKPKQDFSNKSDAMQSELDSRSTSKPTKLQSVFCSSLSWSKPNRGRGKMGTDVRGRGSFVRKEFQKDARPYIKQSRPEVVTNFRSSTGVRGAGRGGFSQRGRGGGGVSRPIASKPSLHPSWEASRKRKEQQGQIQAFQGKKIKFDD